MTMLLDDPPRTRVRAILKRVLKFRDCPEPPYTKPLILPMLGHKKFKKDLQRWMVQRIQEHKPFLVPFHLPNKSVIVGKLPSIRTLSTIISVSSNSGNGNKNRNADVENIYKNTQSWKLWKVMLQVQL